MSEGTTVTTEQPGGWRAHSKPDIELRRKKAHKIIALIEVDHPLPHLRGQSPALHGHPSCPYEGTLCCCSPETVGPVRLVRRENHDDPSCVLPRSCIYHQPFPCSFDHFDFRNRNRG